jgi:cell wall-associated NlpC family hydrolase
MEGVPKWCGDYIGIPFQDRGRDRKGLDCYGLVKLIYQDQLGLSLPSYDDVYGQIHGEEAAISDKICHEAHGWQRTDQPEPFDVVVFRIAGLPLHVGIVVIPDVMIHSLKGCNVSLERYRHPLWDRRREGFYRANR